MLAKLCSGQSYFLSYFDRLTQNPFCVIVLCCLTPLSTISKFYRSGQFSFIGGGSRAIFFCFVQKFFLGQHELECLFFLSRKARIFFPEFNIRLYDKNSESDYFFFLQQNQNIFFSNIGNQYFFRKKT
jgi:hypothetical protein